MIFFCVPVQTPVLGIQKYLKYRFDTLILKGIRVGAQIKEFQVKKSTCFHPVSIVI
jgi:hypothetical protein